MNKGKRYIEKVKPKKKAKKKLKLNKMFLLLIPIVLVGIILANTKGIASYFTDTKEIANNVKIQTAYTVTYNYYKVSSSENITESFGIPKTKKYASGQTVTIGDEDASLVADTTNYTSVKFKKDNVEYDSGDTFTMPEGDVTIDVLCHVKTYTITYNLDGGEYSTLEEITSANYGDYIDLGLNIVKTSATTDDWRILYNDTTNGKVYAILADYLPVSTTPGSNAVGSYYRSGVYGVRNQSLSGASDALLSVFESSSWKTNLLPSSLNTRTDIEVKGAVTGEILMASYNEKHNGSMTLTWSPTQYFYNTPGDSSSGYDDLYVPRTTVVSSCYGYWLGSRYSSTELWYVGCGRPLVLHESRWKNIKR